MPEPYVSKKKKEEEEEEEENEVDNLFAKYVGAQSGVNKRTTSVHRR
jgi:hypothetical protein